MNPECNKVSRWRLQGVGGCRRGFAHLQPDSNMSIQAELNKSVDGGGGGAGTTPTGGTEPYFPATVSFYCIALMFGGEGHF